MQVSFRNWRILDYSDTLLGEYGGLVNAENALHIKVEGWGKEAAGLEEQAKLKGKTQSEVAKLKAEKSSLEAYVAGLHEQMEELNHMKAEVSSLGEKEKVLLKEISDLETRKNSLAGDIETKGKEVSNLKELKVKYDALLQDLAEVEDKIKHEKGRWEVFEGFLGLVQSSSLAELQKSARTLPKIVEQAQEGEYSLELLKSFIFQDLAGPTFQVMKCSSCGARFYVDKPAPVGGYQCPIGGFGHVVVVEKDAPALLKAALATAKPPTITFSQTITPVSKPPQPKDKGNV